MGCSASRNGARNVWSESHGEEACEGGRRRGEPAGLSQSLRMKRYELLAGVKLAMVESVGGGLYDADNRSIGSLGSNGRRRLGDWVEALPTDEPHHTLPAALPGALPGGCGEEEGEGGEEVPPSPLSSTETLSLPVCGSSANSSETLMSPVRLHSRSQLTLLERSLSASGSRSSREFSSSTRSPVKSPACSPPSPKPRRQPSRLGAAAWAP